MRPHEQLPLFILWSSFLEWLLDHTEKFPKHARFTLSGRIDNFALDILEGIVEARYSRSRVEVLKRVDMSMEKLGCCFEWCTSGSISRTIPTNTRSRCYARRAAWSVAGPRRRAIRHEAPRLAFRSDGGLRKSSNRRS
jgi:hypothetical protein